jgi:xylulokinase
MGCGIYKDNVEAFASLKRLAVIEPDERHRKEYLEAYANWKNRLAAVAKG